MDIDTWKGRPGSGAMDFLEDLEMSILQGVSDIHFVMGLQAWIL